MPGVVSSPSGLSFISSPLAALSLLSMTFRGYLMVRTIVGTRIGQSTDMTVSLAWTVTNHFSNVWMRQIHKCTRVSTSAQLQRRHVHNKQPSESEQRSIILNRGEERGTSELIELSLTVFLRNSPAGVKPTPAPDSS